MNQARLERLTGLIKSSQYRSYDIKVPKDDLWAALKLITSQAVEIARLRTAGEAVVWAVDHAPPIDIIKHIGAPAEQVRAALSQDRPPLLVGLENQGDSSLRQEPSHPAVKADKASESGGGDAI